VYIRSSPETGNSRKVRSGTTSDMYLESDDTNPNRYLRSDYRVTPKHVNNIITESLFLSESLLASFDGLGQKLDESLCSETPDLGSRYLQNRSSDSRYMSEVVPLLTFLELPVSGG